MPNSNIHPSSYVPFTSIYYISAPDEAGDLLVVGFMTTGAYSGLSGVPLPDGTNQLFCNPITLAPGIVANAYVPTAAERLGNFSAFNGLLFDPTCVEECPYYYPGGQIPITPTPGVFAWRIPATQPGPPVYVSTGSQILAVDGSSGVTSVLYTSSGESPYYDLEGLVAGPDNLIYITDPGDGYIFRMPQAGTTELTTVYQYSCSGETCPPNQPQGPSFSTTGQLAFNTENGEGVWQISFDSSDNPGAPVQIIPSAAASGEGSTFNHADELLIVDWSSADVLQQTAPGASSTTTLISGEPLSHPVGVAVNSSGNIFVSNFGGECDGYIEQFDSTGNDVNTYVDFGCEQPWFIQFDASDRLYVVTSYGEESSSSKVYRVDPIAGSPPTGTATLLVDLGYAYSNNTITGLNWSGGAVGVALPGTGTGNSYTTPPQPIPPTCPSQGCTVTTNYGTVIPSNTYTFPPGTDFGDAATASIAVNFQLWNPTVFNTTRLPATSTNTWSGGTPVPSGTTCTPIAGTGGNCIVIEVLCFDANGNQILPHCQIEAPSGSLIGLSSKYKTQSSQSNPGLIIADDGGTDWANITTGYSATDPVIKGGTSDLNTDTAIVNLGLGVVSPSSIDFGTVYLGTITTQSVTVTNQGTTPMTITNPRRWIVSGGDSHDFEALNLCPRRLAAGKSCTIYVRFHARPFYTLQTATLEVMDSAPSSPQTVALSATVIDPRAHLSARWLNFGTQEVNTSSAPPNAVTLTNTGATALTNISIAIAGTDPLDFLQTNNCPSSLLAKASCRISVTFKPTAKGRRSGSVVITDNARNSPQGISLWGKGD